MGIRDLLDSLPERLQRGADVKTAYGEPISAEGKTIVPVARVGYGFGGGLGTLRGAGDPDALERGAGGVGGGLGVVPIGVVEVTRHETRFIPFSDYRKSAAAAGLGVLVGLFIASRFLRRSRLD